MFKINFRAATLNDIKELLNDSGFLPQKGEFDFAEENELFKFLGVVDGAARYMIGFNDGPEEDDVYAAILYVKLCDNGFTADWGGCPAFETKDVITLSKYFETRCN